MSIVLVGSTSGSITLQEPAVAGTTTIDLPATSGTMVVTGGAQTVQFAAGSASTPAITTTGDTNTGIFFPAADTIAFAEGGAESMRIDSSGNVGIGLTPPVGSGNYRSLNVGATFIYGNTGLAVAAYNNNADINDKYIITGFASSYTQSSGNHIWYNAASGSAGASISFTERMRIDSSGNLLFNSGYGSVATAYGCRAWVNFDGSANTNLTGTYSQTGTTVTVTITAHGYVTGSIAYLDFTSGTAVDGDYTVTVTDANTFTVTQASRTTSGSVTSRRNTIRGSGNVSSITDSGTGVYVVNFTNAMPDTNYSVTGATNGGGGRDTNFLVALTPASTAGTYSTTAVQVMSFDIGAATAADSSIVSVVVFR